MTKALVTGVTGQDGSYLAELLLEKGYEVHGIVRRSSSMNRGRIDHLRKSLGSLSDGLALHYGDLADGSTLNQVVKTIKPDEIYNLGAQSHVRISFDMPEYTAEVAGVGTLRLLDAIRNGGFESRFYQASSSEMFGSTPASAQGEDTPFHPRSPYAVAKVFSYWITVNYRESYGMHTSNGILFNHESPRRGENFVTRKITRGLARILSRKEDKLVLGNLEAARDWGYAKDYVEAMWLMLQQPEGDDYVVATGESHTIREFLEASFGMVGLDWNDYVTQDPKFFRPAEVDYLHGDYTKARTRLGWTPRTSFQELVRLMVVADLEQEGLDPEKHVKL
ncbi:MAG TPA: GDP-mannose 4,6-dehydratase [Candidatus Dormibacteraeota bacterium]|jgi:GDPmannose 4,6-dehydratase|nr:GDP-mannose 4,6-dehydratase [Candidatus Dormibacteraeota bacterium]